MSGKKYKAAKALVETGKLYPLNEALALACKTASTNFDSSVEVHMHLGIDPKQAEQQLRSTVSLPHGTGKTLRVVAFVSDDKVAVAKTSGAIEAGNTDLINKIEGGWMDFDVAVATPDMMKELAKIARILGQSGLMPNPKSGTVTPNIESAIGDIMKGQVEFRNDKLANLHNIIGKVSFGESKLFENAVAYFKAVKEKKPEKMKGDFVRSITVTTSMGPGIKVEIGETMSSLAR